MATARLSRSRTVRLVEQRLSIVRLLIALFEFAYSRPEGFFIDEAADELGTHMCIPPHWEDRRPEIEQLEPIDTIEEVKA